MNFSFFPAELARAICWTLIHSLWQGVLFAVITGLVLLITRRSHPGKRYVLLTSLFFLFMAITVITFIREWRQHTPLPGAVAENFVREPLSADISGALVTQVEAPVPTLEQRFIGYFNRNAAGVVLIWLIIFMARFLKLGADLMYVQRLRSYRTRKPIEEWLATFGELLHKLRISEPVQLLESGLVKVPMTIGMLKPVILLPAGLLTQLPPDEIEAILLHELAHIRRRDYLVNLVQSFAEAVFFFNPAFLWLSSLIREERESCCDELAISVTNNKTKFINALISFQEYRFADQRYGMAFPGKKNQLLNRVKRIVHNKNKTLNTMEKSILTSAIAAFLLFSFVNARKTELPSALHKNHIVVTPPAPVPSTPAPLYRLTTDTGIKVRPVNPPKPPAVIEVPAAPPVGIQPGLPAPPASALAPLPPLTTRLDAIHEVVEVPAFSDTIPDRDRVNDMSINESDNGTERTLELNMKTKGGAQYRLKKLNGVLKELVINGKQIPEQDFDKYRSEIDMIERNYRAHRENSLRKHTEAMRHRADALERKVEADRHYRAANEHKLKALNEMKAAELERKRIMEEDMEKIEKHRKSGLKHEQDLLQRKIELRRDSMRLELQEKQLQLKKKQVERELEQWKQMKKDSSYALFHDKPLDIKRKEGKVKPINLKLKPAKTDDSILRLKLQDLELDKSQRVAKMSPRYGRPEDEARAEASANVMRGIMADLKKENITVDTRTGWFALDNRQFVVDGKDMTAALHEKFRGKYIKADGWGYYYGNVKVTGKGIFLANKDVSAR